MNYMFYNVVDFRQDLCSWGSALAHRADSTFIDTRLMFAGTDCPSEASPVFTAVPPGPFCFPCANTTSLDRQQTP
jgi:hypothetical protein